MAEFSSVSSKWCKPCAAAPATKELVIYNSLTRSKVPFVPMDPKGKTVTMYVCGPTVYDAAHLGHARTYIQFDVVRRVLRDVAGYDVTFVMNVTDVDDKIIMRSNERGVSSVALAREWEAKFLRDMAALGVERPSIMPRVTEYIPEIVSFVARIVDRGLAYAHDGSVYFDTGAFAAAGHSYGKLLPESIGSEELMAEGEGKLFSAAATATAPTPTKKDPKDFALWKASKPGEPSWESPWGLGRPGWHIECSAMIAATVGQGGCIDIHGGGVDLRFPHHDNELAQSEAWCGCHQSVNYFAHTGHLHIRGLKMSKSLKNFVTIDQALKGVEAAPGVFEDGVRATTMRLMFCQVKYNAPCDYSDNMLANARAVERKLREFFQNVAVALRQVEGDVDAIQRTTDREADLAKAIIDQRAAFRTRLLDDFDTPGAILALQGLVDAVNAYLLKCGADAVVPLPVAEAALVVHGALGKLGIEGLVSPDLVRAWRFSSHVAAADDAASAAAPNSAAALAPLLDVLASFRDDVRNAARSSDTKKVLELCDLLRDDYLPELGVRLEDRGGGSIWKLDDPATLRAEKQQRKNEEDAKEQAKVVEAHKKAAKDAAAKIDPRDMFKEGDKKYAQFDADGIPTHDDLNEPLLKSQCKKLRKEWEKQKKMFDKANEPS